MTRATTAATAAPRRDILRGVAALACLALVALATVIVLHVRQSIVDQQRAQLHSLAQGYERTLATIAGGWQDAVALVASRTQLRVLMARVDAGVATGADRLRVVAILEDAVASMPRARRIRALALDGETIATTDPAARVTPHAAPIAVAVGRDRDGIASYILAADNRPLVVVAGPVRSEDRVVAVIELTIEIDEIAAIARDHSGLGATGEVMIGRPAPGGAGWLLAPPRYAAPTSVDDGPPRPTRSALLDLLGEGIERSHLEPDTIDYRGRRVFAISRLVDAAGLGIVVKMDRREALAPLGTLMRRVVPVVTALAALVTVAACFSSRRLSRELDAVEQTERLSRELHAVERRASCVVETAADGVVWLSEDQEIKALNPAAEALLGFSAEAVQGRRFDHLEGLAEGRALGVVLRQLIATPAAERRIWRGDLHLATGDGGAREIDVAASVGEVEGRAFVILILRDVTERNEQRRRVERALAAEQESLERQRAFTATISHEFRTPLAVIDGVAQQLMRREMPKERAVGRLLKVRSMVARLTELVDSALQLGRIERFTDALTRVTISLRAIVDEVVDQHRHLHPDRIVVIVAPPGPYWIAADPRAIRHILDNLVSNALKYSPSDQPVHVMMQRLGDDIRLVVIDRGRGIPEGERDRMFERFQRASNASTVPGTGLGLYVVRELVIAVGGRIELASEEGLGSAFTLTLPSAPAAADAVVSAPAESEDTAARPGDGHRPQWSPFVTHAALAMSARATGDGGLLEGRHAHMAGERRADELDGERRSRGLAETHVEREQWPHGQRLDEPPVAGLGRQVRELAVREGVGPMAGERQHGSGGDEAVDEHGYAPLAGGDDRGRHGHELAAAQASQHLERPGGVAVTGERGVDGRGLPGEAEGIDTGAGSDPVGASAAQQTGHDGGGHGGVGDTHLADGEEVEIAGDGGLARGDGALEGGAVERVLARDVARDPVQVEGRHVELGAGLAGELTDGGAAVREVGDHLRRHAWRKGRDTAGGDAVIAGEDSDADPV